MRMYSVTFTVAEKALSLLLGITEKYDITLDVVKPIGEVEPKGTTPRNRRAMRNKGISGRYLFLRTLTEFTNPTSDHVSIAFQKHGFASTSASPTTSKAVADGLVKVSVDGCMYLTVKGKQVLKSLKG